MPKSIALLRGINVSGKNKIRMADLKALFEGLGCTDVSTYLQSGNVVFDSAKALKSKQIEQAILNQFQLDVPVLSLPGSDLEALANNNPYLNNDGAAPSHCYLTFLWETPSEQSVADLELPNNETGQFAIDGNYVYVHCPNGYGRTKIHTVFFEKKLKLLATTRNWKTLNALLELSG